MQLRSVYFTIRKFYLNKNKQTFKKTNTSKMQYVERKTADTNTIFM